MTIVYYDNSVNKNRDRSKST